MAAQIETIRVNVLGMLNLADICFQKNLHLTTYATGVACTPMLTYQSPSCMHVQHPCSASCMQQEEAIAQLLACQCQPSQLLSHVGCIFHYDKDFPEGSGKGFKESDKPNFTGSYYSYTKVCLCCCRTCKPHELHACSMKEHVRRRVRTRLALPWAAQAADTLAVNLHSGAMHPNM